MTDSEAVQQLMQHANAAALRAVADQVVPEPRCPIPPNVRPFVLGLEQRLATRAEMLAIAAELEGSDA